MALAVRAFLQPEEVPLKDFFETWKFKILIGIAVFLVGIMAYAGANDRLTAAPQELLSVAVAPFQRAAAAVSSGVASLWENYANIDAILEENQQLSEENASLRSQMVDYDKLKAENDALKKQPITAVVDKEEVERQAREMAAEMTADLRAQLEQTASGSEQDAHSSYDNVLLADRSFQNIGKMVIPSLRKLPQEQREAVANQLIRTLGQIQGEVSQCL